MKSAKTMPEYPAGKILGITNNMLEAQIIYSALELELFSHMETGKDIIELSHMANCDIRNLELIVKALVAIGYLKKETNTYTNFPEINYYLNKNSDMYIGEHILYWRDMTNLHDLTNLVRHGSSAEGQNLNNGADFFDFRSMGKSACNVIYTGRVQSFISALEKLFSTSDEINVLDMGGGSGILALETAIAFPNSQVTVFDQAKVIPITIENIKKYGLDKRVNTKTGNFVTDNIGNNYGLIIASGVMDFAGDLDLMAKKLHSALNKKGYLIVTTHAINEDYTAPKQAILGWLSSRINGLDILKTNKMICNTLYNNGFQNVFSNENGFHGLIKK